MKESSLQREADCNLSGKWQKYGERRREKKKSREDDEEEEEGVSLKKEEGRATWIHSD